MVTSPVRLHDLVALQRFFDSHRPGEIAQRLSAPGNFHATACARRIPHGTYAACSSPSLRMSSGPPMPSAPGAPVAFLPGFSMP